LQAVLLVTEVRLDDALVEANVHIILEMSKKPIDLHAMAVGATFSVTRSGLMLARVRVVRVFASLLFQAVGFGLTSSQLGLAEDHAGGPGSTGVKVADQTIETASQFDQSGKSIALPSSPAAVDRVPGTGALGRWLGLPADSPWRLGGFWVGNGTAQLVGGGANPGGLGGAQQFLLDLSLDLDRSLHWKGAKLWVQGLQVNANQTAATASGSLQGSNSLVSPSSLARTDLYSYAFSQFLFEHQLRLLVGKLVPSNDFANVVLPDAVQLGSAYAIPGISSLTYTPLYAMPTLLGRLPGNSVLGASLLVQPKALNRDLYLKLGVFDGRGGSGIDASVQAGQAMPSLSGPLVSLAEVGGAWFLGQDGKPGAAGFGFWHQGGPLSCTGASGSCSETSAAGGYLIAQQRLINFRYPKDISGISAFLQAGWSPALSNLFTTSIGGGFTLFAPMRSRQRDSYGVGFSWAQINQQGPLALSSNPTELMVQAYGQIHLVSNLYLTPSITILPIPGDKNAMAPSTSVLVQLSALF
jgi:porin